jgi:hypothetical protein
MSATDLNFLSDPYEAFLKNEKLSKNIITRDPTSKFAKKFKALRQSFSVKKTNFLYGGLSGMAIGAMAGFAIGLMSAYQTKRIAYIPISILFSAVFCGGVMAFGSIIRSAELQHMRLHTPGLMHYKEY